VQSTKNYLPVALKAYVAVEDELTARALERYFKSGSGKAFAMKRFCANLAPTKRRLPRAGHEVD